MFEVIDSKTREVIFTGTFTAALRLRDERNYSEEWHSHYPRFLVGKVAH